MGVLLPYAPEHPGSGVLLRRDAFAGAEATEAAIEIRYIDGLVVAVDGDPE